MKNHFLLAILFLAGSGWPLRAQTTLQTIWETNAHVDYVRSVDFSGDSKRLASGSPDGYVKVWALATNAPVQSIFTFNDTMLSVALSSDGSLVGAGSGSGSSRMWRVGDGVRLWRGGPENELAWSVCFSSNDLFFGIGRTDGINVREALTGVGALIGEPEEEVYSVAFSPDGQWLASGNQNRNASLWRVGSLTEFQTYTGHANSVVSVDFSRDGSLLLTGSSDGTARLWNVTNGVPLLVITNGGGVVKFLGDGRYVMNLDAASTFKIFRVSDGHQVGGFINTGATCFAAARDGRYFAYGTGSGTVVLAYAPLIIEPFTRDCRRVIMHWTGGSGDYQVQRRLRKRGAKFRNYGPPTVATSARVVSRDHYVYRVISLPPP